jgi:hypothetical protein
VRQHVVCHTSQKDPAVSADKISGQQNVDKSKIVRGGMVVVGDQVLISEQRHTQLTCCSKQVKFDQSKLAPRYTMAIWHHQFTVSARMFVILKCMPAAQSYS